MQIGSRPFRIFRIFPGLLLGDSDDKGFDPLGAFDHAYLDPGALVAMHEHQNDEIFSYIRKGTMFHKDSSGAQFSLTPDHLSVMNAGSGISHEESVPNPAASTETASIAPPQERKDAVTPSRPYIGPVPSSSDHLS